MLDVLQAIAARTRHICRQSGALLCGHHDCGDDHPCRCCCWANGNNGGSSGGGGSTHGGSSCRSRRAGLCCGWLSSLLLGWDWLPLATSETPVARAGTQTQGGLLGGAAPSSSGITSRGVGGSGAGAGGSSDVAVALGSGDAGGMGIRRLASSSSSASGGGGGGGGEDVKPLLTHSKSAEFREKEKRFIKGRFVLPGSDVQRRIAEAMAGMLAAGGRAMTTTDGSSGGGAVGPNRNSSGSEDGYREVVDQDSPSRREGEGSDFQFSSASSSSQPAQTLSSSQDAVPLAGGAIGAASCTSSPRRDPSSQRDVGFVSGVGSGGARGADELQEAERECVICMEEFSKEDPAMLTLCSCGVNKTFFHYSCLLQWLSKHSYCPACRGYLYFEERRPHGNRSQDGFNDGDSAAVAANTTSSRSGARRVAQSSSASRSGVPAPADEALSSDEYGRAFRRALRAGLDHQLTSPRRGTDGTESP